MGGGGGGREECPPDNISLTILIITTAGITSRQIIGIILVNLDWRYIQNVLAVLIAENLSLKKLIDATLSPLSPGHFKKFNVASKMATKNMPVTNLAITMYYNPQNALFMHISSPVNAIEDDFRLWGILLNPRWQIQGSFWKCHIFPDLHYYYYYFFFEDSDIHFSENG